MPAFFANAGSSSRPKFGINAERSH